MFPFTTQPKNFTSLFFLEGLVTDFTWLIATWKLKPLVLAPCYTEKFVKLVSRKKCTQETAPGDKIIWIS